MIFGMPTNRMIGRGPVNNKDITGGLFNQGGGGKNGGFFSRPTNSAWRPSPQQPTRPQASNPDAIVQHQFGFGPGGAAAMMPQAPVRPRPSSGGSGMTANQMQAQMTREQFADFENRLAPMLDNLYRETNDPRSYSEAARKAMGEAGQANRAATGVLNRQLQQFGRGMTADQRQAMATQMQVSGAANQAAAATSARTRMKDQNLSTQMDLLGIEQGLADNASTAAGQAAQMETNRNQQNDQLAAQRKQNKASTIGTVVGLGMMMLSSEAFKQEIVGLRDTPADKLLDSFTIKTFRYRPEVGLGDGIWIGPLVEELPDVLKDADGILMNMYNAVGLLIDRCQRQEKRIRMLEDKING
jgi:hypothetical protein